MSRKKLDRPSRFLLLPHFLLKSDAWRSLGANERAIYIEIAMRYMGSNNGRITYAVREAAQALHIGQATACRALQTLEERGFIEPVVKGAFRLKLKHATEWRLTEYVCDVTGQPRSAAFMSWKAAPQAAEGDGILYVFHHRTRDRSKRPLTGSI